MPTARRGSATLVSCRRLRATSRGRRTRRTQDRRGTSKGAGGIGTGRRARSWIMFGGSRGHGGSASGTGGGAVIMQRRAGRSGGLSLVGRHRLAKARPSPASRPRGSDQVVDARQGVAGAGEQPPDVVFAAHVAHRRKGARAALLERRRFRGAVPQVSRDHRRALGGEQPRRGATDARDGAGDDHGAAGELHRFAPPLVGACRVTRSPAGTCCVMQWMPPPP